MKSTKRMDPDPPRQDAKKIKTDELASQTILKGKELSKKIVDLEEAEAESRMGDEDFEIFRKTCNELQEYMQEILQLKLDPQSEEVKKKIAEKRVEASLLFVTLRQLNRLDKLRLKKARDVTHDVKHRVDSFHLQLENLLYEVFHLRKEVDKCLEFRSKDEDIELVDVEAFYQEAPQAISKPETTRNDQHKQTLARLEWEFEQRKRLSERCRELETNKEKASVSIARKQKQLESLLPRLNSVLEATRPLQEELNMPLEKMKYQRELAVLLPDPLYILYSQMKAYSEAVDSSVTASVEGTKEDAVNFGSKSSCSLDEILEDVDSAESDMEIDYETNKRSAPNPGAKVDSQSVCHPLRVQVTVDHVCITFSYLTSANLIAVDCKLTNLEDQSGFQICSSENLLTGIFPNDHGDDSAWINPFQAKSLANGRTIEVGKPYLWAQKLAGLEISGSSKMNGTSHLNSEFVESVITAVRNRIRHREQLNKILGSLASGRLDLDAHYLAYFPATINSHIVSWTPLIYDECVKRFKHSASLFRHMEIDPKNVMLYNALIQRDSAKLFAVAAIPMDYPNSLPIFSVELDWHGKHNRMNSEIIRNVEAEVNIPDADTAELDKAFLLNFQLKKLCLHLDLITEIDGHLVKKEQGGWQAQNETEFRPEKMIPQIIKGHNRLLPVKYEKNSGFFLHRCDHS